MFKDSRELDRQRTASRFSTDAQRYSAQEEKWFDGSIGSVDHRLGMCDRLLHSARFSASRFGPADSYRYLAWANELDSDRRALVALREDLLNGASDREDVSGPSGRRTASANTLHQGNDVDGTDRRWVELESARFVAANTNAFDDLRELAVRAKLYAQKKTSTFTPERSGRITAAFVDKVADLGRQAYVPAPMRTAFVSPVDVDPQAMFL